MKVFQGEGVIMLNSWKLWIGSMAVVVAGVAVMPGEHAAVAKDEKKSAATFEVYKDKGGEFRWRLRAGNQQIIASSGEGYKEKRDCIAGVESVKRSAAEAAIEEVEATKP